MRDRKDQGSSRSVERRSDLGPGSGGGSGRGQRGDFLYEIGRDIADATRPLTLYVFNDNGFYD